MTAFDPILHFFSLEFTAVSLFAKFEVAVGQVSSFSHSSDIEGVPKFKSGPRDLGHTL